MIQQAVFGQVVITSFLAKVCRYQARVLEKSLLEVFLARLGNTIDA